MKKRILSLILALSMLMMFVPCVANAEITSGECGENGNNVTWSYNDGTLTISGEGNMVNYTTTGYTPTPWEEYKSSINTVIIEDGIRQIGNAAFYKCEYLTKIIISDSVTSIGREAFELCTNLMDISIPNNIISIGINAFAGTQYSKDNSKWENGCLYYEDILLDFDEEKDISEYIVKDGTRIIADSAFVQNRNLTKIIIPKSVTNIGKEAFAECINLKSVSLTNGLKSIGTSAFRHCYALDDIIIPESVTELGERAFFYCGFSYMKIPENITYIPQGAFWGCSNLVDIELHNNINGIGNGAFYFCTKLQSIEIPDCVTDIDHSAFCGCSSLESITIPNQVSTINEGVFLECVNLKDVYYCGTKEEWEKINIFENNEYLINADIHYNTIGTEPPLIGGTPTVMVKDGTYKFNVQLENVQYSSNLFTVVYKDGLLQNVVVTPIETGDTEKTVEVTANEVDTAKVFIWSFWGKIRPLCESKTIEEQDFVLE